MNSHFQFNIFKPYSSQISHAVSTRHVNFVETGFKPVSTPPIYFKNQMHGKNVFVITKNSVSSPTISVQEGDAFITNLTNTPIGIRIADCIAVQIFDPVKNVIANIHAGWRGLAKRIIRETILEMTRRFKCNPADFIAGISPSIGPCCYEFGNPHKELPRFLHSHIMEENMVNIWTMAEEQLAECGIKKENIENPRICTSCNIEDYYSFRREGDSAGRMVSLIMLRRNPLCHCEPQRSNPVSITKPDCFAPAGRSQ